jgi:hypothetical protein
MPAACRWNAASASSRRASNVARSSSRVICDRRLDYTVLSREFGCDFAETYAAELASLSGLETDQIVCREPDGLVVTPCGTPLLHIIEMRLDASTYAPRGSTRKRREVVRPSRARLAGPFCSELAPLRLGDHSSSPLFYGMERAGSGIGDMPYVPIVFAHYRFC